MKEERMKRAGASTTGYTANMPEVCERAWDNVREVMRHIPGSAFHTDLKSKA